MRLTLISLLAIAGCDPQKIPVGDDTAALDDSGDTDTEIVDDTGDTDDTGDDTGETDDTVEYSTLTFVLGGATDADAIQLDWLDDAFQVIGPLAGAAIAGNSVAIEVPDPDEDDLIELAPGLYARYAIPYAYVDDGDVEHDDDEEIRGVGRVWPLYLTGDIPIEYGAAGFVDGWNAVWVEEGESPDVYDIGAIPLAINLTPTLEGSIGGTVGVELGENPQLAVIPSVAFEGRPYGSLIYNQGLDTTWSVAVSGAPPSQHITDISGTGFYGALEIPLAFNDANGDAFPAEDELIGPACLGTYPAVLFWISPPTDPIFGFYFVSEGLMPGWLPVRTGDADDFVPLTEEEASTLVLGDTCSLG